MTIRGELINSMFIKNFSPDNLGKKRLSSFQQNRNLKTANKFRQLEPANHHNQALSFDPQAQLKSKIIRAILSSNDTIQKQIDYKRSVSSYITSKKSNFKLQLNLKQNPKKMKNKTGDIPCKDMFALKYNEALEVQRILGRQYGETTRLSLNSFNFKRCSSQSSSRPSTRQRHTSLKKAKINEYGIVMGGSEHIEIRPWAQSYNDKEFQYI